ncbi:MAG: type II toxin-antitoxin system RelE/ParE family toxin [Candidatus Sumerlaeaceae bacterium]|nr:type II toxin-antitoxin system RelE/ParE family toxin [Candidatus Sumerlaeaceae bacterium]
MITVEILSEAEAELTAAVLYYQAREPHLALEFLDLANRQMLRVVENPLRYPSIHGTIRRTILPRFPFGIIYSVEAEKIIVIAVMHLKRRPNYWRKRLDKDENN